ncbi:hypothetical protein J7E37_02050 [Bacillus sp. ISL-39]|nr:hypothetical protein [Bacillus sp. ISL-39]
MFRVYKNKYMIQVNFWLPGSLDYIVDSMLMRFTDFVLNFPFLVFVIVLATIFLKYR